MGAVGCLFMMDGIDAMCPGAFFLMVENKRVAAHSIRLVMIRWSVSLARTTTKPLVEGDAGPILQHTILTPPPERCTLHSPFPEG